MIFVKTTNQLVNRPEWPITCAEVSYVCIVGSLMQCDCNNLLDVGLHVNVLSGA